jgi:hypothetical protein
MYMVFGIKSNKHILYIIIMEEYLTQLHNIVISNYTKKDNLIIYIKERLRTPENIIDIIISKLDDENIYKKYLQILPTLNDEEHKLLEQNLQTLLKNIDGTIQYRNSYFIIQH